MDAANEVKQRLNIEDIVSEYVQLKRSGRNLKGLSPFTSEKTPSFMVSPEKQIWHDFSSGKGGDMISFIQEVEGLDFRGALELLARKAGIDLEQFKGRDSGQGKLKERLYEASELAVRFYQAQLKASPAALEYLLKKRAFTKDTVIKFGLGYAPQTDDALLKFLRGKNFSEDEIGRAGLITKRYRGPGDMFRGRIMVPLHDAQGRAIGFTARLLYDEPNAPKYINTPQTLLYDKGRHAYGLHLAKESIRKSKFAVIVEGNLDVIASHQAGVTNVVATAGTALTEANLKNLGRFASDLRFAFDSDRAGIAATERAIPIAQKVGINMSIITIPEGKDPDELVRKDPKAWEEAITQHQYALDWLIDRYKNELDLSSGQGKRQFTDIILKVIRGLSDQVEQDHYMGVLAKHLDVSADAIRQKLLFNDDTPKARYKTVQAAPEVEDKQLSKRRQVEQKFLAIMLHQPALRKFLDKIPSEVYSEEQARDLAAFLQANPTFSGKATELKGLQQLATYVKMIALQFEELYQNLELLALRDEVTRLQVRLIDYYVKAEKSLIKQAFKDANETKTAELLSRVQKLDQLLR